MKRLSEKTTGVLVASDFAKIRYRVLYWFMFAFLLLLSIICIFPSIWLVISSFKDTKELLKVPPTLLPEHFNIKKVADVWQKIDFGTHFLISLSIIIGTLFFMFVCTGLSGYSLSRIKPIGSGVIQKLVFWSMLMPAAGGMVITFAGFVDVPILHINLMNTHIPMWLMGGGGAFNVLLFKSYFDSIDKAYLEAARIDGCGNLQAFFKIIIPLSVPIILTLTIFTVNASWGAFLWPSLIIRDNNLKPVAQVVSQLNNGVIPKDVYMMALMLMIIPTALLFCCCSKRIMGGFNLGGIKG